MNIVKQELSMTKDYQLLVQNAENQAALVTVMFETYKNFIYKKAIVNSRGFHGKVDVEDYVSDVYLKLFYYANYIKLDKVKPDSFMFYIHVNNACCDILTRYIKVYNNEASSLNDEDTQEIAYTNDHKTYELNYKTFYAYLTPLQQKIFQLKQQGKTTVALQKELHLSYFLVTKNLQAMKKLYDSIF